jgi:hypothetical protein
VAPRSWPLGGLLVRCERLDGAATLKAAVRADFRVEDHTRRVRYMTDPTEFRGHPEGVTTIGYGAGSVVPRRRKDRGPRACLELSTPSSWLTRLNLHLAVVSVPVLAISAGVFGCASLRTVAEFVMAPLTIALALLVACGHIAREKDGRIHLAYSGLVRRADLPDPNFTECEVR